MKVKDLINALGTLNPDWDVFAKDELGWFYPADIITEDAVCKNRYNILGKAQNVDEEWKEDHRIESFNPNTVTIGGQTWMAANLAIDDGKAGIHYNPENKQYYYTWDAAMRIAEAIPGWHLPSAEEWNTAAVACGAMVKDNKWKNDPSMRDYTGTESMYKKLGVLPAGYYYGSFPNVGSFAYVWSATEYGSTGAYYRYFDTSGTMNQSSDSTGYGFSVRLVKD